MLTEHQKDLSIAVFFALIASLSFSIMSALVKYASADLPTSVILFSRFFIGLVFLFLFIGLTYSRTHFTLKTNRLWLHLMRGLIGVTSIGLFYLSVQYIPLVNALLLQNTSPLFMPLLVWLSLGVRTSLKLLASIFIGFIGVLLVIKPGYDLFHWGALFALSSGVCSAIVRLSTRQLSKTENKLTILVYYYLIATIVSGIVSIHHWVPLNEKQILLLIAISLSSLGFASAFTFAVSKAPARIVSPMTYVSLIFGGILEWYFWGRVPDTLTILGMVVVVISAVFIIKQHQREVR